MDTPTASSSARDAPSVPLQPDSVVRAALSLRIVLIADQALGGHSQTLAQAVRGPARQARAHRLPAEAAQWRAELTAGRFPNRHRERAQLRVTSSPRRTVPLLTTSA